VFGQRFGANSNATGFAIRGIRSARQAFHRLIRRLGNGARISPTRKEARVQSLNDFIVFETMAVDSFTSDGQLAPYGTATADIQKSRTTSR
jgi:hypothetical protein